MTDRPIIGLDVGRLLGVAVGVPGLVPQSYSIALAKPSAGLAAQGWNLIKLLDLLLSGHDPLNPAAPAGPKPFMLVKEAPLSIEALLKIGAHSIPSTLGMHLIVRAMCFGHGVRCEDAHVGTVTKHFLGSAKTGGRAERKAAIIRRCRLLGYVPADCNDEDRCDALACWDFAAATYARAPSALRLFGEEKAA